MPLLPSPQGCCWDVEGAECGTTCRKYIDFTGEWAHHTAVITELCSNFRRMNVPWNRGMAGHKGTLLIPVPCPGPGAPEARAAQRHIRGLEHLQGWGIPCKGSSQNTCVWQHLSRGLESPENSCADRRVPCCHHAGFLQYLLCQPRPRGHERSPDTTKTQCYFVDLC